MRPGRGEELRPGLELTLVRVVSRPGEETATRVDVRLFQWCVNAVL